MTVHTEKVTEMREFLRFISDGPFLLSDLKKGTKKVANPPNEKLLRKVSRQNDGEFLLTRYFEILIAINNAWNL